jgi:hypothetical protein
LSTRHPQTLAGLKERLVRHFFGALEALKPAGRFALHPELRADLAKCELSADALRQKWLSPVGH